MRAVGRRDRRSLIDATPIHCRDKDCARTVRQANDLVAGTASQVDSVFRFLGVASMRTTSEPEERARSSC